MTYSLGEGCRNGSRGRRAGSVLPRRAGKGVVAGVAVNAFRRDRRRGPRRACWWPGSSGLPRHLLAVAGRGPWGGAALGPVQILAGSWRRTATAARRPPRRPGRARSRQRGPVVDAQHAGCGVDQPHPAAAPSVELAPADLRAIQGNIYRLISPVDVRAGHRHLDRHTGRGGNTYLQRRGHRTIHPTTVHQLPA
jgi:hypothetical protein